MINMNIFVRNVEKVLHTRKVYPDTEGLVWSNPKTSNVENMLKCLIDLILWKGMQKYARMA